MPITLTHKQRQLLTILGGAILILVLVGVGWARVGRQGMLRDALQNFDTARTYHVRTELKSNLPLQLRNRERPFNAVSMRVEGDVQKHESGTPELTGRMFAEARGRGAVFFMDGDLRLYSDRSFFRLDNLPLLLNPSGSLIGKWTEVNGKVLQTRNGTDIRTMLATIPGQLRSDGSETIDGQRLRRFTGGLTAEQERELVAVLQHSTSGNHAWHILARLLNAYDLTTLKLYVSPSDKELHRIDALFTRQSRSGKTEERARLVVDFSDFGKEVTLDTPPSQLTVRPEIFTRLFNAGEITPQ